MSRRRRLALAALIVVGAAISLVAIPAAVMGHVELVSSSPKVGANLDTAPTEVTITFDDELNPEKSSLTVTDADGNEVGSGDVDLTVADRNVLTGAVSVSAPGVYTVSYTVAGIDGHEIDGTFSFGFNTIQQIPRPSGSQKGPDTAMPRPEPPLVELAGGLLVALATLMAGRGHRRHARRQ